MTSHEVERWSPFKVWLFSLFYRTPKSNLALVDRLELSSDDRFLDVGCGLGAALEQAVATGAEVVGVDPSPSMVEKAAQRVPTAEVTIGSAEDIPYPDDHFTVAINIASFHHWADRDAGLKEILRVLAPGGRLHVVEGALRPGKDGHGLDPRDSELLAARLGELGYIDTAIDRFKTGWRHEYYAISGTKPEGGAP